MPAVSADVAAVVAVVAWRFWLYYILAKHNIDLHCIHHTSSQLEYNLQNNPSAAVCRPAGYMLYRCLYSYTHIQVWHLV